MLNRMSKGDKAFLIADYIIVTLIVCAMIYPFLYILSGSISSPEAVNRGQVWLLPVGWSTEAYKTVLSDGEIWSAYGNTLFYVIFGTLFGVFLTVITAYPMSRKKFGARNVIMMIFAFTMFFSGGLIPTYLVVKTLHMVNTRWAMIILPAMSVWNMIIVRTFFENIPETMFEAATIDGCNDLQILFKIVIHLSMPVIAVMILFYAVGQWNSYFLALVYLNDDNLQPLQMILRKVLIQFDANSMMKNGIEKKTIIGMSVRYAVIIVSTLPILCVYPFLQKYFVKGVMIGAIKG